MSRFKIVLTAMLFGMSVLPAAFHAVRADQYMSLTLTDKTTGASVTAEYNTNGTAVGTIPSGFAFVSASSLTNYTGMNEITFSGKVGNTGVSLSETSSNTPGTPTLANLSLGNVSITNTTTNPDTIAITASANGYTAPSTPPSTNLFLTTSSSGTVSNGSLTSGSYTSYIDTTNALNGQSGVNTGVNFSPTLSGGSLAGTALNSSLFTAGGASAPYAITSVAVYTTDGGTTLTSAGGDAHVIPTPEPATIALALSGLPLLGLVEWRRRKSHA